MYILMYKDFALLIQVSQTSSALICIQESQEPLENADNRKGNFSSASICNVSVCHYVFIITILLSTSFNINKAEHDSKLCASIIVDLSFVSYSQMISPLFQPISTVHGAHRCVSCKKSFEPKRVVSLNAKWSMVTCPFSANGSISSEADSEFSLYIQCQNAQTL